MSTSGVEQNFPVRDWFNTTRRCVDEQLELDLLQIYTYRGNAPENEIITRARKPSTELYGKTWESRAH